MNNSPPTLEFGPVTVVSKKPSESGMTVAIKLQQPCLATYAPGTRPHLLLQESLAKQLVPHLVRSLRKATQRLTIEQADELTEGQQIGGHIQRTLRATPRYSTQKAAYEGGYASSCWVPEYSPDLDLRELQEV